MAGETVYKRRRVSRACDRCREIKAKCDGKQPVCGRCAGYGYLCRWDQPRVDRAKRKAPSPRPPQIDQVNLLNRRIQRLDQILQNIRANLGDDERKSLDLELSSLQISNSEQPSKEGFETPGSSQHEGEVSPRYLGEASDIRFYNTVKKTLCSQDGELLDTSHDTANQDYSYDQDTPPAGPRNRDTNPSTTLPSRFTADKYVNIYFSTIHIAYPFISKSMFDQAHDGLWWRTETRQKLSETWKSLLLTVYAIGACYESFSGSGTDSDMQSTPTHQKFFEQAQAILARHEPPRHLDYVCTLLTQCFYLLATSQTDRCWTTHGIAVRVGQSIGLHTEDSTSLSRGPVDETLRERRRRTWYSLYVLDRLLSLQLGRPPAIYITFFNVCLPCATFDIRPSPDRSELSRPQAEASTIGEYFIAMISFSHVIGEALEGLYGPNKIQSPYEILPVIEICDAKLLQWKSELPRRLRFDLGHTFDSSIIFKRQRNMLAVKFYHLRSLIHRPCVSLSRSSANSFNTNQTPPQETQRILSSKLICVSSAQGTAHLLYGLEDKKNLVHDFPWWQMISCLICASSILLVATLDVDRDSLGDVPDMATIEEDADICLKVFEALSISSNAARLARDMMQGLKETRYRIRASNGHQMTPQANTSPDQAATYSNLDPDQQPLPSIATSSTSHLQTLVPFAPFPNDPFTNGYSTQSYVPNEISEPIIWSAQFVNAEHNPFLNSVYDGMQ